MPDDFDLAVDFLRRADMAGTRNDPFPFGTAVLLPQCPLRHDSNYLFVDSLPPSATAADLAAEADRLLGGAGLGHRMVMFRDPEAGERLVPGLVALGWRPYRSVLMAHRRPPEPRDGTAPVVRVDPGILRAARVAHLLSYPWATPEIARQILDARDHIPVETRHYAALVDGEPASWIELYLEGGVAQAEALATVERHRNRGLGSAVLLHAVGEARRAGAGLVFLAADAEDWPKDLYRRLGFDGIGRLVKCTRDGG